MKISLKTALFIVALSVFVLTTSNFWYFTNAQKAIEERVFAQLETAATLKENRLSSFMEETKSDLESISSEEWAIGEMSENKEFQINKTEFQQIEALRVFLEEKIKNEGEDLREIYIITADGSIYLSTNSTHERDSVAQEDYFTKGLKNTFIQSFYYETPIQEPSVIVATPIKNEGKDAVMVLAARINPERISDMMAERPGLGESGETILVNKYNMLVSKSRFTEEAEFEKLDNMNIISECIEKHKGRTVDNDYRGVPSLMSYTWLPENEVCLIAKIDESESLAPVEKLKSTAIFVTLGAVILSLVLGMTFSRTITSPLSRLNQSAIKLSRGDLSAKAEIKSKDEIGELAGTFNNMATALKEYQEKLIESEKKRGEALEKEVGKKTSELNNYIGELEKTRTATLNMLEDLKETNDHLKDLDKAKSNFLNIVSHELKTPLTAMFAYLDILKDLGTNLTEDEKKSINAIRRNSDQLKSLINNILEISRIEAGKFELINSEINPIEKIGTIVENLKPLAENKGLALKTNVDKKTPKMITDEQRFEEIFNNLISNAIKFTEKGSIVVSAKAQREVVLFSVADTGVGMLPEKMENLFNKFYQVDASISRRYGGTGLGLSITKQLIELQGGKIWVESEVDKGTTFFFTLPIQQAKKEELKNA